MSLTKIINKSNNSFIWKNIVGSTNSAIQSTFVTGTIENENGNITVTNE